jgi:hypothetical protein
VRALVVGGDLERAASSGRGLFEDQSDVLSGQLCNLAPVGFGVLEAAGEGEQGEEFFLIQVDFL